MQSNKMQVIVLFLCALVVTVNAYPAKKYPQYQKDDPQEDPQEGLYGKGHPRKGLYGKYQPLEGLYDKDPQEGLYDKDPQESFYDKDLQEGLYDKDPQEDLYNQNPQEGLYVKSHPQKGLYKINYMSIDKPQELNRRNCNDCQNNSYCCLPPGDTYDESEE